MESRDAEHAHPWFATLYDPLTTVVERRVFASHRAHLTTGLTGRVLDVGSGTGAMFPYYADNCGGSDVTVHALEPDPYMLRRARAKADRQDIDVRVQQASAESLPYEDDSFDVVVATLVFCTIDDCQRALTEIERVLSPLGQFRFFEHVRDSGWRQSVQTLANPLWKRAVGGCNLDRDTERLFTSHDRFDVVECERLRDGVVPVNPFVRGVLELGN